MWNTQPQRRTVISKEDVVKTVSAVLVAGAIGAWAYVDNKQINRNAVVNEINKIIFNYLDKQFKNKIIDQKEYNEILNKIRDNKQEALKNIEFFMEKEIIHIKELKKQQQANKTA